MTLVMETTDSFAEQFERSPGHPRAWVNALRARGMKAFRARGFPTTRQEEWRDTNVTGIARTRYALGLNAGGASAAARELVARNSFGKDAAAELVFLNGRFELSLSRLAGLPKGVRALSLANAMETDPGLLERHLGKSIDVDGHPFAALNTGFLGEGAVIHLAEGAACERPIHLLFVTTGAAGDPPMSHPRILVVAEEGSASSIVETYAGADAVPYLTNGATEMVMAARSRIDHNKLQLEGDAASHVALMHVDLAAEAAFVSHSTSIGGALCRNDLQVYLNGERAEATLNGLVYAKGGQHIDNHTLLHHEKAHCPSHELYKHVLAESATAVFKGKIFVQKDAQKTDSKQTSKALLLSNEAFMNSQPALEIYADDVKCTHGSTTGPVDENAVFYLVSRGLSLAQARHLMTYAFAADITRRIKVPAVRARIEAYMAEQHGLPQDIRITEEAAHDVALR